MKDGDLADEAARRLFERRTVLLGGPLDAEAATRLAASLMTLDAEGDDTIRLLVNSPGGPLECAFPVIDTLDLLRAPVEATCIGQAQGTAAAVVACAGGRRRAAPSARLSLRLAGSSLEGPAGRLERDAAELLALRDRLVDRVAAATGRPRHEVAAATEDGGLLPAAEAVAAGLVDEVAGRP